MSGHEWVNQINWIGIATKVKVRQCKLRSPKCWVFQVENSGWFTHWLSGAISVILNRSCVMAIYQKNRCSEPLRQMCDWEKTFLAASANAISTLISSIIKSLWYTPGCKSISSSIVDQSNSLEWDKTRRGREGVWYHPFPGGVTLHHWHGKYQGGVKFLYKSFQFQHIIRRYAFDQMDIVNYY